ncbi:hypothetical protein DCAR_0206025 [Daucus carota subsp. sativus]|uniref:Uncharacterized protein n=2 Tax=Daucus carota subsp. sativus TaxID=79200 RepID=A0AAF1AN99_DAUCS|nr:PREDICTED: uncharacterized protein LOC108207289 [Daucus carota subsp. sativus]WOG86807.1 hypothetical protein DCAR_0206025 [Daucus carota subsp. sativus]
MGYKNIITVMFYLSLVFLFSFISSSLAMGSRAYDSIVFDEFVREYAEKAVKRPRTGTLYNISLPSNYSGVEVSYIRLKSGSLWNRGRNSTLFMIPKRISPEPYVNRVDMIFQNVGNLSSFYFDVPNYTFVAPVVGFHVYGADANYSGLDGSRMVTFRLREDPIVVRFPSISLGENDNVTMKCVRFGTDGSEVEFSSVTAPNYTCNAYDQGHFSIVVPSLPPPSMKKRKKRGKVWLWLIIGGGGFISLILSGILVFKMLKTRKIETMVKESEKSEALDIIWIGKSKMPSASIIRTQPVLENDYFP